MDGSWHTKTTIKLLIGPIRIIRNAYGHKTDKIPLREREQWAASASSFIRCGSLSIDSIHCWCFLLAIHNVRYISQSLIIHDVCECVYLSSMCSFKRTKRKLLYNSYDIMFLFLSFAVTMFACACYSFIDT